MVKLIKTYGGLMKKQLKKSTKRFTLESPFARSLNLNGKRMLIRPANPSDSLNLYRMHTRLSRQTLYYRYMMPHKPGMQEMEMICGAAEFNGAAFVAQLCTSDRPIVGYAYYQAAHGDSRNRAELAVVVEDRFQGCGIGKALMYHVCQYAAGRGFRTLLATIHPLNNRMIGLVKGLFNSIEEQHYGDVIEMKLHMGSTATTRKPQSRSSDAFAGLDLGL